MKNILFVTMAFIVLSGCETMEQQRIANNVPTKYESYLGVGMIEAEKGVKVFGLTRGDPASKAGIMSGDILKEINGSPVQNYDQAITLIRELNVDSEAIVKVERNGKTIDFHLTPKERKVPKDIDVSAFRKICSLLGKNKKVSVLIIVGEISNSAQGYTSSKEWERGISNVLQSNAERNYLTLSDYPNFKIVDRNKTEELIKELKFSLSGIISDEFRAEVGRMTGATHILHITFGRFPNQTGSGFNDTTNERLISVETGEVIGSDSYTN